MGLLTEWILVQGKALRGSWSRLPSEALAKEGRLGLMSNKAMCLKPPASVPPNRMIGNIPNSKSIQPSQVLVKSVLALPRAVCPFPRHYQPIPRPGLL